MPEDLRYTNDHEWVRSEGDTVVIGVTDFAQDNLGDVVFVELPEVGSTVTANEPFGEIESTKSVSDLFSPIDGTVTAINPDLEDAPETVNSEPYGEGWLITVTPADVNSLSELLDADAYRALIEG